MRRESVLRDSTRMVGLYTLLLTSVAGILLGSYWALNPSTTIEDGLRYSSGPMGIVIVIGCTYGFVRVAQWISAEIDRQKEGKPRE